MLQYLLHREKKRGSGKCKIIVPSITCMQTLRVETGVSLFNLPLTRDETISKFHITITVTKIITIIGIITVSLTC